MITMILFVVSMFLWFLTLLPFPATAQFEPGRNWLAFVAVLILGIHLFARF